MPSGQSFYIYATSAVQHEGNTQSNFRYHLPYSIPLQGEYYCGLKEIYFPTNITSLNLDYDRHFYWTYGENEAGNQIELKLPHKQYVTIEGLVEGINGQILSKLTPTHDNLDLPYFTYKSESNTVWIFLRSQATLQNQKIKFSPILSRMLSFEPGVWNDIGVGSTRKRVNFEPGLRKLNVLCNFIEGERVGTEIIPLLRSVVVRKEENNNYITSTFDTTYYKRVRLANLDMIHCELKTEEGTSIQFDQSGETILLLHFIHGSVLHNYF